MDALVAELIQTSYFTFKYFVIFQLDISGPIVKKSLCKFSRSFNV